MISEKNKNLSIIVESRDCLGESPMWDCQTNCLYWTDLYKKSISRFNPETKVQESCETPDVVASIAIRKSGGLIVSLAKTGFAFVDFDTKKTEIVAKVDMKENERFNDGRCDRQGRFYSGILSNQHKENPGYFLQLGIDKKVKVFLNDIACNNAPNFSLDSSKFYYADSFRFETYILDFDKEKGECSNKKIFAKSDIGYFDGAAIDKDGYLWWAIQDGYAIRRYSPEGILDREFEMPFKRPTSCIWGGKDFKTLFITSCYFHKDFESKGIEEPNGKLFAMNFEKENYGGIPEAMYLG